MLQDLDKEKALNGLTLVTVDVDKDAEFLATYKAGRSVIFLFAKGREVNRLTWETDKEKIRAGLKPPAS